MHTGIAAILLATAPASTPNTPSDRAAFEVADAEVVKVDNAAHLVTFDSDGESTATLSVWVDGEGRHHLDADFSDGLYMSAVTDGENVTIDSPDSAEVAARAHAIDRWIGENGQHASWREWGACAGHLALAVVECPHPLGVVGCGLGIVGAYCHCGPLINEEIDCPP